MARYLMTLNGKEYDVNLTSLDQDKAVLTVNGKYYEVAIKPGISDARFPASAPVPTPAKAAPTAAPPMAAAPEAAAGSGSVLAPIPGAILDLLVREGDTVRAGQAVLKMEAMKMENEIRATASGVVKEIRVRKGDSVSQGQLLLVIG